jgi:hypothetical protein
MLEILLLGGFAWLGGSALRRRLLPRFEGSAAGLATTVLALALLIWPAELLGSFGAFELVPYLLIAALLGMALWWATPRPPERGNSHPYLLSRVRIPSLRGDERQWRALIPTLVALLVATVAVIHFAPGVKTRLSTGMTGFDSTWYHGPFAAGFFQSGDTWQLHFIAPQFLAWFYPANGEIFHAVGMLAFDRDLLSPLLNLGWFVGCLVACWCVGRPYGVAPWSLALGAIALSVPALADQAGEARNDIVGIFFLLAAVAIALNAWTDAGAQAEEGLGEEGARAGVGAYLVVGLAAGLAAGTKLNFLLPAAVLVVGLALVAPRAMRWRALGASMLAAFAGGGYWYLRNLAHAGNPLPWARHLGPVTLPAPEQALGGREAHSVLGYLSDGDVWSDWFLPGLHSGLWFVWPLLLVGAIAGLLLCLVEPQGRWAERSEFFRRRDERSHREGQTGPSAEVVRRFGPSTVAGLVGLAGALAWLIAPTSASGPEGMPRGFESGVRYLAPALILGLALLPIGVLPSFVPHSGANDGSSSSWVGGRWILGGAGLVIALAIAIGYPVQRHYLQSRYEDPTFAAPGLNAAFAWARDIGDSRIATTSTRQYPLFGTDLSNRVQYLGIRRPHGGYEAPRTCRQYRRLLDEGGYDYVVVTRDRLEPGKPPYPSSAQWTHDRNAHVVLKKPPTLVFKLTGSLSPSACR